MADQRSLFDNFLNNQFAPGSNNNFAGGFKLAGSPSFLQPSTTATPSSWNSSPQRRLQYITDLKKQGYSEADIQSAIAGAEPPPTSEARGMDRIYNVIERTSEQNLFNQSPEGMERQLEMGRKMANAQAKDMLKYQTLANLPGQIERSFAADKYYAGISQIPEIYRNTFASVPNMNIQAPGYSAAQVRYFS